MAGITDIGANAAEEAQQDDNDYDDYERFDVSGLKWLKQHPTTAVRGNIEHLRYFPDWDNDQPDRGYFGLVLDDPGVYDADEDLANTAIFKRDEEMQSSGDDFKIVNLDDDSTKELPGGGGIDFMGNTFYGERIEEFDTDRVVLKATGGSGRSIASTLDVKGAVGARSVGAGNNESVELHDGGFPEHNGGLVEYHPDGRDGERPRFARDPELRPDVQGKEIIVMIQRLAEIDDDYDGSAYWATVLVEDEEGEVETADGKTFTDLEPTDEFEPSDDLVRSTGYITWNRVDLERLNEARADEGFDPYEPDSDADSEEAEAE